MSRQSASSECAIEEDDSTLLIANIVRICRAEDARLRRVRSCRRRNAVRPQGLRPRRPLRLRHMTALAPYVFLPGTAREALHFYAGVFDCSAEMHTLMDFGRTDGPPEAIAHGVLSDGPISLFAADATGDQSPFR